MKFRLVTESEAENFTYYKAHRPEQFDPVYSIAGNLMPGLLYCKKAFYHEINALHSSGLLQSDKHFQLLKRCLIKRDFSSHRRKELIEEFGLETLKGGYLIAEALGMRECLEKLNFVKPYKRKNTIPC